jgi:hypothetical protein
LAIKLSGLFSLQSSIWLHATQKLEKLTIDTIDVITISQLLGVKLCGYRAVKDKNIKILNRISELDKYPLKNRNRD